jgi:thiosulfate/3-mercaptopyruvate sulfurtransferase
MKINFSFSAHIPQARYFDQLECTKPTKLIPRGIPEIKCFESYLSRLGVSNNDHIVLYDRSPMGFYASSRAWWLFKVNRFDYYFCIFYFYNFLLDIWN